jgi:hypothetical protein
LQEVPLNAISFMLGIPALKQQKSILKAFPIMFSMIIRPGYGKPNYGYLQVKYG